MAHIWAWCSAELEPEIAATGLNAIIEKMMENYKDCQENMKQTPQPMTRRQISDRHQTSLNSIRNTLVLVDYFSKKISVEKMEDLTSKSLTTSMMNVLTTYGFLDAFTTDNVPQYSRAEFKRFCKESIIQHTTSSSHYPQSNGEAERPYKLWKVCGRSPQVAIMDYNATSIAGVDFNPAQLLMNRRIKTSLIISTELLKLMTYSNEEIRQKLEAKQT